MKICDNCKKEFNESFKFCPFCGNREDGKKVCPTCGEEIQKDYQFCFKCGYNFNKNLINQNKTTKVNTQQTEQQVLQNEEKFYTPRPIFKGNKVSNVKFNKGILNFIFRCVSLAFSFTIMLVLLFSPVYTIKLDLSVLAQFTSDDNTEITMNLTFTDLFSAGLKSFSYDETDWEEYEKNSDSADAMAELQKYFTDMAAISGVPNINMGKVREILSRINYADLAVMSDVWTEYGNASIISYQFLLLSLCILAIIILNLIYFIFTLIKVIKIDKSPLKYKLILNMFLLTIATMFLFNNPIERSSMDGMDFSGPYYGGALILPFIFYLLILGMAYSSKLLNCKIKFNLKKTIYCSASALLVIIIGFSSLGGIVNLKGKTDDYEVQSRLVSSNLVDIFQQTQNYKVKFDEDTTILQMFPFIEDIYKDIKLQADAGSIRSERDNAFSSNICKIINSNELINNNLFYFILIIISCVFGYATSIMMVFALKYILKNFFEENNKNIKKGFIFSGIGAISTIIIIILTSIFCISVNNSLLFKTHIMNVTFALSANPIFLTILLAGVITLCILYFSDKKSISIMNCAQKQISFEQYQNLLNQTTNNNEQKQSFIENNSTVNKESFIENNKEAQKKESFTENNNTVIQKENTVVQNETIKEQENKQTD